MRRPIQFHQFQRLPTYVFWGTWSLLLIIASSVAMIFCFPLILGELLQKRLYDQRLQRNKELIQRRLRKSGQRS